MNYTIEAFADLALTVNGLQTTREATALQEQIDGVIKQVKEAIRSLPRLEVENETQFSIIGAIDADLEGVLTQLEGLSEETEKAIRLIEDEDAEELLYGSYHDQVRATYYAQQIGG